jgi:transketolase
MENINQLNEMVREMRKTVLRMTNHAKAGHVGGSLSELEILAALYFRIMRINPENPSWKERDRFILSKGHATPGYYTVLAYRGYFPMEILDTFDSCGSSLQAHPDMHKCPGVDYSTGSLGQGLSIGIGMSLAAEKQNHTFTVYVLVGDGEAQEGQIWEALMYMAAHHVKRIVCIFDANNVQLADINNAGTTANELSKKLKGFDLPVLESNGHDLKSVIDVLREASDISKNGPVAVVARTIKGKGISFMEGTHLWHGRAPNDEELAIALTELEGGNS